MNTATVMMRPLTGVVIGLLGDDASLSRIGNLAQGLGATVKRHNRLNPNVVHDVLIYGEEKGGSRRCMQGQIRSLLREQPRVIALRLSHYGSTGPEKGLESSEALLQARTGIMAATGGAEDPVIASTAALSGATQTLAGLLVLGGALLARKRQGVGDHLDIAAFDVLVTHVGTLIPTTVTDDAPPPRIGNRHGMTAPWNSYFCRDGHVMICTMGESMWIRLMTAIGRTDALDDYRFNSTSARVEHVDSLDAIINNWTRGRAVEEVVRALRSAEVACAPVRDVAGEELGAGQELNRGYSTDIVDSLLPLTSSGAPGPVTQGGLWMSPGRTLPPLTGIRVLELAAYTAGPMAGWLLSNMGATVMKVEPPEGEPARRLAKQVGSVGYLYFVNNGGKHGCRLDLRAKPCDRHAFERLAATTDVVLTNLSEAALSALDLKDDVILEKRNVVHCRISGYGRKQGGRAFDTVLQAESGIMSVVGAAIRAPRKMSVSGVDVLGGYAAAAAIVMALLQRYESKKSSGVHISLAALSHWLVDITATEAELPQVHPSPTGFVIQDAGIRGELRDVTGILNDPQVKARNMLIAHSYKGSHVLVPGNPLRSHRWSSPDAHIAPADEDYPEWPSCCPSQEERKHDAGCIRSK